MDTPRKINIESENDGLEDDFPLQMGVSETWDLASYEPCLERTHLQNHRLTEKIEVSFDDDADQMEVEPEGPMDQWTNGWNGGLS